MKWCGFRRIDGIKTSWLPGIKASKFPGFKWCCVPITNTKLPISNASKLFLLLPPGRIFLGFFEEIIDVIQLR